MNQVGRIPLTLTALSVPAILQSQQVLDPLICFDIRSPDGEFDVEDQLVELEILYHVPASTAPVLIKLDVDVKVVPGLARSQSHADVVDILTRSIGH